MSTGQATRPATLVIDHIGRLVTCEERLDDRKGLGVIEQATVVISGNRITYVGPRGDVAPSSGWSSETNVLDAGGRVVVPGFVDCHTHLCFGGDRSAEYQERRTGVSYERIAARGGGILFTVEQTRRALREKPAELADLLRRRLDVMLRHGTTTAEVKSGYGLSTEAELATLSLYQEIGRNHPVQLVPTFLGAHEIPAEFRLDGPAGRTQYLSVICEETLPAVAERGLARFCDVFCESGVFSVEDARRVLRRGLDLGLRPKIHCDQFSALGGLNLAAELGATSADHLHVTAPLQARVLAGSGTVAVGLPGVTYFLGLEDHTPWSAFCDSGVPLALATDFNPGTSMTNNLQMVASIASSRWRMPDSLIVRGLTIEGARAVGLHSEIGSIAVGKQADLLLLDCRHESEVTYHFGVNHIDTVVKSGQVVVRGGQRV